VYIRTAEAFACASRVKWANGLGSGWQPGTSRERSARLALSVYCLSLADLALGGRAKQLESQAADSDDPVCICPVATTALLGMSRGSSQRTFNRWWVSVDAPQIPNPKPQTPNSKPQTPNPKPQTPNPKSQTLNPEPQIGRSTSGCRTHQTRRRCPRRSCSFGAGRGVRTRLSRSRRGTLTTSRSARGPRE